MELSPRFPHLEKPLVANELLCGGLQILLESADGFKADELDADPSEFLDEGLAAGSVVVDLPGASAGQEGLVQGFFRDIDTGDHHGVVFHRESLPCKFELATLAALATVRAVRQRLAGDPATNGLGDQGRNDLPASRLFSLVYTEKESYKDGRARPSHIWLRRSRVG